jgi:hypothetical protein
MRCSAPPCGNTHAHTHATDLSRRASYKDTPLCPQCKVGFNYLYVHRQLDGTVSDYAIEVRVRARQWCRKAVRRCALTAGGVVWRALAYRGAKRRRRRELNTTLIP